MVVYIAGVPYTIDQIYLALYGDDNDRQRSTIGQLFNYFNGNIGAQQDALNNALTQFISEIQKESNTEEKVLALAEKLNKLISGNINNIESEDSVIERYRKLGLLDGFDEKRYAEISKQQLEKERQIKEKEGCDKLSYLQGLSKNENPTWKELTKIEYIKQIQNKKDIIKLESTSCNKVNYYFMSLEIKPLDQRTGQIPYNKTMLDNPTNFEN
jgi:hypothetical protein